jgi:hypothetical protein
MLPLTVKAFELELHAKWYMKNSVGVTVNPSPAPPGNAHKHFAAGCQKKVSILVVVGSSIKWYMLTGKSKHMQGPRLSVTRT